MPETVVSLGSNVEAELNLRRAVAMVLAAQPVQAVSSPWLTLPVGPAGQPDFVNAALLLDCADPLRLKQLLRAIEDRLGRLRTADTFAPRPIDLDLLLHGSDSVLVAGRPLPDPGLLQHAHLAVPAAEVLPGWRHPLDGRPLAAIAAALLGDLPAAARPRRLDLPLAPPRQGP